MTSPGGNVVDTAYIKIAPDPVSLAKFAPAARKQIDTAMGGIRGRLIQASSDLGASVGTKLGQAFNSLTGASKRSVDESIRHVGRLSNSTVGAVGKMRSSFGSLFSFAAVGFATLGVGQAIKGFIDAANDQRKINAQTAAVIKSTGGAANVTAAQIGNLSGRISALSGIQDDNIQAGANMLLTFTNVRNEVGRGNDIFNQATQTVTDMSVALGQDFKSSAVQLGKALNDPIKGVTALQRVGVTFTESQKKTIQSLVDSGDALGAQKLILRELNKEFGGSAAAQATAGSKLAAAWDNIQEQLGNKLLPVLDTVANWFVRTGLPYISHAVDVASKWISDHWDTIRSVFFTVWTGVQWVFGKMRDGFVFFVQNIVAPTVAWIRSHWPQIQDVFRQVMQVTGNISKAMGQAILWLRDHVIIPAVTWIREHWPEISKAIQQAWAVIKPALEAVWRLIVSLWHAVVEPFVKWVQQHWPQIAAVIKIVVTIVVALLYVFIKAVQLVANILTWFVNTIVAPLMKVFLTWMTVVINAIIKIWAGLKTAWQAVADFFTTVGGNIIQWFKDLPGRIKGALGDAATWLVGIGKAIVNGLWDGITSLGSWLIDKIEGIIPGWIKKALGIGSPPKWAIQFGKWIAEGLVKGITHFPKFLTNLTVMATEKLAALAKSVGGGFVPRQPAGGGQAGGATGSLADWITSAEMITGTPLTWGAAIQRRIMFESGGNPNAINLWDSNAAAGDPSRGLMQTIGSTFAAYHQPGTSNNIYDPVANIAAALNYIKARYGSIFAIDPPVQGYREGAWSIPDNRLAFLHKAEMVVPAKPAEQLRSALSAPAGPVELSPASIRALAVAMAGLSIDLDGQRVAHVVSKQQAAQAIRGGRR